MLKFSNYIKENNHSSEEFAMVNGKLKKMSEDILELTNLIKEGNIDPWIFDKISVCTRRSHGFTGFASATAFRYRGRCFGCLNWCGAEACTRRNNCLHHC